MTLEDIEERAAIISEGEKVSQKRAERITAWLTGYDSWVACAPCNWSKGDKILNEWRPMQ